VTTEHRLDYWKRRARDAESSLEYERRHNDHTREWAQQAFAEQRRLADRLHAVSALAAKHGLPIWELLDTHDEVTP
jgi:hypothetical protein